MPGDAEIPILMRGWAGIDLSTTPTELDPSILQSCDGWVPSLQQYLLTKRRGNFPTHPEANGFFTVSGLYRTYTPVGDGLLFFVTHYVSDSNPDSLFVSFNEGNTTFVLNGTFATKRQQYNFATLGNTVYVSNGVDPIKAVDLTFHPFTAVDLVPIGVTNDTGQTATPTAATGTRGQLPSGTYSYVWAVYDTMQKKFVSRGPVHTIFVNDNFFLTFVAPTTALPAGQIYKLFVTEVNLPVELSTDQSAEGFGPSATFILNTVDTTGPLVPVADTVTRTGQFLIAHRDALWVAGDHANPSKLYKTGPIIPGLEQDIFDQGNFFPALAVANIDQDDGDEITGLGVVSLTTTQQSPSSPLGVFKNQSIHLVQGDLDDPSSLSITKLSSRIGCISHRTIVNTPIGLIFCGRQSVYLLPPSLQEPIEIGWPIAPIIRNIPATSAAKCWAIYHNNFYKLYYVAQGEQVARHSLWLDLRTGQLSNPPPWFGPHTHVPPTFPSTVGLDIGTVGERELEENSRAWAAVNGGLVLLDQPGVYTELGSTIISTLVSAAFASNLPFDRKLYTRCRIIAKPRTPTQIAVTIIYDDGLVSPEPPFLLLAFATIFWNRTWNRTWGRSIFQEGDDPLVQDRDRQPHLAATVVLNHSDPIQVDLRDVELRYEPIQRKVA